MFVIFSRCEPWLAIVSHGGQICKHCMWCYLVTKFSFNASGATSGIIVTHCKQVKLCPLLAEEKSSDMLFLANNLLISLLEFFCWKGYKDSNITSSSNQTANDISEHLVLCIFWSRNDWEHFRSCSNYVKRRLANCWLESRAFTIQLQLYMVPTKVPRSNKSSHHHIPVVTSVSRLQGSLSWNEHCVAKRDSIDTCSMDWPTVKQRASWSEKKGLILSRLVLAKASPLT